MAEFQPSGPYAGASGALIGFAFGFVLEKSKVYLPTIIHQQMLMTNFQMLKVFLMASASGSIFYAILQRMGLATKVVKPSYALGFGKMKGYGANVVGGALLGIGMTLSGACPGTIAAQIGSRVPASPLVYVGGLVGAVTFATLKPRMKKKVPQFQESGSRVSLNDLFYKGPMWHVVLGAAAGLAGVVAIAESARPWQSDVEQFGPSAEFWSLSPYEPVWNPIMSGLLIGALQIPSLVLMQTFLGTSSSYCAAMGVVTGASKNRLSYLTNYMTSTGLFQSMLLIGVAVGAGTSLFLGGLHGDTALGVSASVPDLLAGHSVGHQVGAFLGGFTLLMGARLAGGCTSGHGISGVAQLSVSSLVSVASMFGGGMAAAQVLKLAGLIGA